MVLVYYTVEKKVRIKIAVVSLWFDEAHLTDSLLEAIKVCQGGNGGRETIPLNNYQLLLQCRNRCFITSSC